MKSLFNYILLILVVIVAAILSRFIGNSDYLLAQSSGGNPYRFYCPYNKLPYTSPTFPYKGSQFDPAKRVPFSNNFPYPKQYPPCPCIDPAIDSLLLN
jgi:hypothetical protein